MSEVLRRSGTPQPSAVVLGHGATADGLGLGVAGRHGGVVPHPGGAELRRLRGAQVLSHPEPRRPSGCLDAPPAWLADSGNMLSTTVAD